MTAGVDPGFFTEGGSMQYMIVQFFAKNRIKLRKRQYLGGLL